MLTTDSVLDDVFESEIAKKADEPVTSGPPRADDWLLLPPDAGVAVPARTKEYPVLDDAVPVIDEIPPLPFVRGPGTRPATSFDVASGVCMFQ